MKSLVFCLFLILFLESHRAEAGPKIGIICPEDNSLECMAGGVFNLQGNVFSGTYMCRSRRKWFGIGPEYNQTICVPTVTNAVLGEVGDTCGCCEGTCPQQCSCLCESNSDHVLLYRKRGFGIRKDATECLSPGKASRYIAMYPDKYSCVTETECPTFAPTTSPTSQPAEYLYPGVEVGEYNMTTPPNAT